MQDISTISVDPATGVAAAEIMDADGTLQGYAIEKPDAFPPPVLWMRRYRKLTGQREGTVYSVAFLRSGAWSCDCCDYAPDKGRFSSQRPRPRGAPCKHIRAAMSLKKMLESA